MKNYLAIAALLMAVWGCQPEPDNYKLYDELVVSTNYDPGANFASYSTYSIATDTIGFVSNQSADTILTNTKSELVRPIISRLMANIESRGFTRVDRNDDPDLAINAVIVNNLNLFQQWVDPGYYYPGYYGYNSYYYYPYPYVETYAENTATLVVEIIDLKNRNANNEVKVIWAAYAGDLVSTVNRLAQTEQGIDQAFSQSPYIQK